MEWAFIFVWSLNLKALKLTVSLDKNKWNFLIWMYLILQHKMNYERVILKAAFKMQILFLLTVSCLSVIVATFKANLLFFLRDGSSSSHIADISFYFVCFPPLFCCQKLGACFLFQTLILAIDGRTFLKVLVINYTRIPGIYVRLLESIIL